MINMEEPFVVSREEQNVAKAAQDLIRTTDRNLLLGSRATLSDQHAAVEAGRKLTAAKRVRDAAKKKK